MSDRPRRVVQGSMLGLAMPETAKWSTRVAVALGLNPGPFTGPGTNTYIIGSGRRRILLDTGQGVPEYPAVLERCLGDHADGAALDRILLTHAHPDHIGGVESVRARFGELPLWKMPLAEQDRGYRVHALADGDVIETEGAELLAIWTPGHARDHLCFYLKEERALFTGDVVLGAGTTVIPRDGDLMDYMDSLRRLLDFDADVIYPAHGPAIKGANAKIREYIAHRELREQQILDALAAGPATVTQIVRTIYTDVPEFLHDAAGVSVEAHLRKLVREGAVVAAGDGRWARS